MMFRSIGLKFFVATAALALLFAPLSIAMT